jgi:competence protein ComEA
MIFLAVHSYRGLRWSSRPTNLERSVLAVHHIDLNRADRTELLQVPGIGESLAQRIEEDRREHGPFQTFEELRRVRGIGPTMLERFRPWLSVQSVGIDLPAESPTVTPQRPPAPGNNLETSSRGSGNRKSTSKKEAQLKGPIDINHASDEELQRLPGIGPKLAKRVIEKRQKRPFASIEELRHVPGIGPKTLERLRPYISIESGPMRIATTGRP